MPAPTQIPLIPSPSTKPVQTFLPFQPPSPPSVHPIHPLALVALLLLAIVLTIAILLALRLWCLYAVYAPRQAWKAGKVRGSRRVYGGVAYHDEVGERAAIAMVWGTDEGTEECIEDIELQDLKPDTTTGETGGEHGRDAELHVGSGTVDRRSVGTGTGRDMEGWDLDAVDIQLEDLRDYPWMEVIGDRDIGQDIEQDIEFYDLRDFPWIEDGSLGCDAADIEGTGGVEGTDGTDAMDTRGEQGGRGFVRL